ncbi:MAG: hypothetical protein V4484_21980 [Pseudomonadota bacterium]
MGRGAADQVWWYRRRDWPATLPRRVLLIPIALAYIPLAIASYLNTVDNFTALRIEPDIVRVAFAAPHAARLAIARADVREVLFGFPGKTPRNACYIVIVTANGTRYQSANLDAPLSVCKAWRSELAGLLTVK